MGQGCTVYRVPVIDFRCFLRVQYRGDRDHRDDRARADAGWRLEIEIEIGIEIGLFGLWGMIV